MVRVISARWHPALNLLVRRERPAADRASCCGVAIKPGARLMRRHHAEIRRRNASTSSTESGSESDSDSDSDADADEETRRYALRRSAVRGAARGAGGPSAVDAREQMLAQIRAFRYDMPERSHRRTLSLDEATASVPAPPPPPPVDWHSRVMALKRRRTFSLRAMPEPAFVV